MSHIPSSAMPHAHTNGDTLDDQQPQQKQPEPEPTTARAATTQAPATATGDREGGEADRVSRVSGEAGATAFRERQPPVDGTVTAKDSASAAAPPRRGLRSPLGVATLAFGGLAIAGGIAAALFPKNGEKQQPKAAKRRRAKK